MTTSEQLLMGSGLESFKTQTSEMGNVVDETVDHHRRRRRCCPLLKHTLKHE